MHVGDLTTGLSKLRLSHDKLVATWGDVSQQWQDQNAQAFEETYLADLTPRVKTALEAMNRLAAVLAKAHQELEP